ncbi:30S ribosomal protein S16 [Candidatus Methylopumilus planktonicus]|uniref:30S ribosomal protein S16 n=1 Tax=Candidatus Methylopumilus planktonicus TaxID=1581557 RepID=UPI0011238981|nr:30S ribosomal protein S16 [Candidatus Methylopumilus planktonicus]QDD11361.1 30S ribosomal protein S16 [Candidatus Methylopumilus planktonicus]QDD23832.1 30S ribosomal protein S16 [Candidatus Methylopumilus planktonicus]
MVIIRLSRGGSKKTPFYNVVVADSRNRRDGRFIERIGFYNPMAKIGTEALRIDNERVTHWKGHGALLSDSVNRLVKLHAKGPEAIVALKKKDADKVELRKAKEAAKKAEELKVAMDAKEAEEKAKAAEAAAAPAPEEAPAETATPEVTSEAAPVEAAPEAVAPEATPTEAVAPEAAPAEATEPPAESA